MDLFKELGEALKPETNMIGLRAEDLRKSHIELLNKFMGLFEEYLENCPEGIEHDNFPDYNEAVKEYNSLSKIKYDATGTLHKLENLKNKKLLFE